MAESVCALQTAEVICWGPIGKAIGTARGDVEGIEDAWLALQDHHELWSKRQQLDLSELHRLEWLPT